MVRENHRLAAQNGGLMGVFDSRGVASTLRPISCLMETSRSYVLGNPHGCLVWPVRVCDLASVGGYRGIHAEFGGSSTKFPPLKLR